jgi:hypothetical protein
MDVLKVIEAERYVDREPLAFMLKRIGSLAVRVLRSKPLASFRDALIIEQSFTERRYV